MKVTAQSGACTVGGEINFDSYVNYNAASAGDVNIGTAGKLTIDSFGVYDMYGALTNTGSITVKKGGKLNVYGNFTNSGVLIVNTGGVINFYGTNWQNTSVASVTGNGDIYFTSSRPSISASWVATAPCLSSYSGGSFTQNLDGGGKGVDMNIKLHVNNANNIVLNGTTSVADRVFFDVNDGHVILGSNFFYLTTNATLSGFSDQRYFVTNNSGSVVKEGISASGNFFFPVGRAEADYTPATITNTAGSSDTFFVYVKNYAESGSNEADPTRGMDRTWNIYSTKGNSVSLLLQHNSTTNNAGDYTTQGGDASAFVTQYQSGVTWQTGTGATGTDAAGTVSGSRTHNRTYSTTATSTTANSAFFSKSSNLLSPLPVKLIDYTATKINNQKGRLNWATTNEDGNEMYQVYKLNNSKEWVLLNKVSAHGSPMINHYELFDEKPLIGNNFYKLECLDVHSNINYSEIKLLNFDPSDISRISLFPNPSNGNLTIVSDNSVNTITITDGKGNLIKTINTEGNTIELDLSFLVSGLYVLTINGENFIWNKI
ncbi:MAG TPA: T9SS type A sorting domain-containing protein [Bacteroidia bacterium]